jgi:hypothetical protein
MTIYNHIHYFFLKLHLRYYANTNNELTHGISSVRGNPTGIYKNEWACARCQTCFVKTVIRSEYFAGFFLASYCEKSNFACPSGDS